jgi:amidase
MERARLAEASPAHSLLHGLPVTVKDTIDTAGLLTTAGSRARAKYIPIEDAPAVARLKAAGAIVLGKTNTPEMAIPYETDNEVFGSTNNPHARHLTCGGSSGGEAAAIAACLSPAGIGSDLSGSIRVPAHFCGIAGLKPTTGRVSMGGHTPAASGPLSLGACIGPLARHVEDLALLFRVLADPTQFEMSPNNEDLLPDLNELRGLHVAWYADDGVAPVSDEIRVALASAAEALADAGLNVSETQPPGVSRGAHLWVELFASAAQSEILASTRAGKIKPALKSPSFSTFRKTQSVILQKRSDRAERLAAAVLEREKLREDLRAWMKTTPLILAPVGGTAAFKHGAARVEIANQSISIFRAFSYSQTFNVFGLPSLAVPVARTAGGLPMGIQVIGAPFDERRILGAGRVIEKALGGWLEPEL